MFHQKPMLGQQIDWSHPLAKGLVGCWVMNEGSGNVFDLSMNGAVGTTSLTSWIPNGINFPGGGINSVINIADVNSLKLTTGITIIARIKPDGTARGGIFDRLESSGSYNGYAFVYSEEANGKLSFYSPNTGWIRGAVVLSTTNFSTVVISGDANSFDFYINGVPEGLAQSSVALVIGVATPKIGEDYSGANFDGQMEYVYVFNRASAPSEITDLYIDPYCMFKPYFDLVLMAYVAAAGGLSIPVAMHLKITENIAAIGSGLKGNVIC